MEQLVKLYKVVSHVGQQLSGYDGRQILYTSGQSSSSPFGNQSNFGQSVNASSNPFAPKPLGSSTPFGLQTRPKIDKYKDMLKRKADNQGGLLVSYDPIKGEWKFRECSGGGWDDYTDNVDHVRVTPVYNWDFPPPVCRCTEFRVWDWEVNEEEHNTYQPFPLCYSPTMPLVYIHHS